MEFIPNRQKIESETHSLAYRIGDIIIRQQNDTADFVCDPKLASHHIRSGEIYNWRYSHEDYSPDLEQLVRNSRAKPAITEDKRFVSDTLYPPTTGSRKKIQLLKIGAAVAGFTGIELATDSVQLGVAGITTGGIVAAGAKYKNYLSRIDRAKNEVNDIENTLNNPDKRISLSHKTRSILFSGNSNAEMIAKTVEVRGGYYQDVFMSDVLDWASDTISNGKAHIENDGFYMSKYVEDGFDIPVHYGDPKLRTEGVVIQKNTSLWKLFLAYKTEYRGLRASFSLDANEMATEFINILPKFAKKHGITPEKNVSSPADQQSLFYRNKVDRTSIEKEFKDTWEDATVSIISLPPATVVEAVLKQDSDPAELWSLIIGDLMSIQHNTDLLNNTGQELKIIKKTQKHTGVKAANEDETVATLTLKKTELTDDIFSSTLSILATAMVRNRVHRYDSMREELLQSISITADSAEWKKLMQLFDTGITAAVTKLPPDSDKSIAVGRKLTDYLVTSAKLMREPSNYEQFYEGMRLKFPDLELPESTIS